MHQREAGDAEGAAENEAMFERFMPVIGDLAYTFGEGTLSERWQSGDAAGE